MRCSDFHPAILNNPSKDHLIANHEYSSIVMSAAQIRADFIVLKSCKMSAIRDRERSQMSQEPQWSYDFGSPWDGLVNRWLSGRIMKSNMRYRWKSSRTKTNCISVCAIRSNRSTKIHWFIIFPVRGQPDMPIFRQENTHNYVFKRVKGMEFANWNANNNMVAVDRSNIFCRST